MFCVLTIKKLYTAYVSKHNSNREKQAVLLMIPNREGHEANCEAQRWDYLAKRKIISIIKRNDFKKWW